MSGSLAFRFNGFDGDFGKLARLFMELYSGFAM